MVRREDGQIYLPLFTGVAALRRVHDESQPYLAIHCKIAAKMALQARLAGAIIDRGGPAVAHVALPTLIALAKGESPPAPSGSPGTPAQPKLLLGPPPRLLDYDEIADLYAFLGEQPSIAQAFLFGVVQDKKPPELAVGVGFTEPQPAERLPELMRGIREIMGPVGVLWLDGRLATLLARQGGAIRFKVRKSQPAPTSASGTPPTSPPPSLE
jgi:hypothetical protein